MSLFVIKSSQVENNEIRFSPEDSHHLQNVLRKKKGDKITCRDEHSRTYTCILSELGSDHAIGTVFMVKVEEELRQEVPVSLVFPQLKAKGTDWILQKCTELGAAEFIPYCFARTVPRSIDEARLERYRRIVHAACKQSERGDEPPVTPCCTDLAQLKTMLHQPERRDALRILLWEREKRLSIREVLRGEQSKPRRIIVAVGPEGGMDQDEVLEFKKLGFLTAGVNRNILRSETACLAAVTVCRYEFE